MESTCPSTLAGPGLALVHIRAITGCLGLGSGNVLDESGGFTLHNYNTQTWYDFNNRQSKRPHVSLRRGHVLEDPNFREHR